MDTIQYSSAAKAVDSMHEVYTARAVGLFLCTMLYQFNHQSDVLCIVQRLFSTHIRSNINM